MPTAVAPSVRSTVGNTPSRAPRKPHTSLPAAPPAKTSVRATPISESPAPFDRSRNGRKVRKPIRVALSMTPIVSRRGKPLRSSLVQSGALPWSGRIGVRTALADVTARSDADNGHSGTCLGARLTLSLVLTGFSLAVPEWTAYMLSHRFAEALKAEPEKPSRV
jgi:hypothetical protein